MSDSLERLLTRVDTLLKRHFGPCGDGGLRQDIEDEIIAAWKTKPADERKGKFG